MTTPAVSALRGTGYNQLTMPTQNPQQQRLFNIASKGIRPGLRSSIQNLSGLASGDQSQFEQLEAPALRQFGELQGALGARFSGLGSGAQRSSAFQHAGTSAAQELAESLQSQRLGLQQSAIQQLLGLYGNLMGTQTQDTALLPQKKPWWQEFLGSLVPGLGHGLGGLGTSGLSKWAGLF